MSTSLIRIPAMPTEIALQHDWLQERDAILEQTKGIVVENEVGFATASEFLQKITKLSNSVEKFRKQYAEPFNQAAKAIKAMADDARQPLEDAKNRLKAVISEYAERQRRIEMEERRKAEEEARKAAEQANAEADEIKELFGEDAAPEVTVVAAPVEVQRRAVNSAVRIVRRVAWEATDESKIPVAFLSLDERKVNAYLRDHKAEIEQALEADGSYTFAPGIRLKFETTTASR